MGWKGKQSFEGGAMLLGAVGLVALVAGYLATPSSSFVKAADLYLGSALSVVGSVLIAAGITLFVVARLKDDT